MLAGDGGDWRRCKAKRKWHRDAVHLQVLICRGGKSSLTKVPTSYCIGGERISNRRDWLQAARRFGVERVSGKHAESSRESKLHELRVQSRSSANNEAATDLELEYFDILQARAMMRAGSAPGMDDIAANMLKSLLELTEFRI